ncbi:putative porin [Fulvivirga sediminis]|uniref:Porin n=1 Tax=Fulvivirga sediminis TaxID=2803949 RepID=A0A937FC46_9BACT|nr:putative porin [Fulvivirga sediminis]MBL3658170.1 putative porin [Fulvivirga sediminis]
MKLAIIFLLVFITLQTSYSQTDSLKNSKLSFTADFRFRIEQDWDSRKSDGSYRDDRSRLRYRLRLGASYQYNEWASFGTRIRTGTYSNQQDPHITLGSGGGEFEILPLGFEKLYFRAKYKWFSGWIGKNTYPFEKQNELFWSDNVYPEGVFLQAHFKKTSWLPSFDLKGGHFIIGSSGRSFADDGYMEAIQLVSNCLSNRLKIFPAYYYFHNLPLVPDGNPSELMKYSILHLGANYKISKTPAITIGIDYYNNMQNYHHVESITSKVKKDKEGVVLGLLYGALSKAGDYSLGLYYTYLGRFSAVDYMAQNDWVRWDYSNYDSPAGRLTNFQGIEFMAGYQVGDNFTLKMRYFNVKQLVSYGAERENGQRVRLDIDIAIH